MNTDQPEGRFVDADSLDAEQVLEQDDASPARQPRQTVERFIFLHLTFIRRCCERQAGSYNVESDELFSETLFKLLTSETCLARIDSLRVAHSWVAAIVKNLGIDAARRRGLHDRHGVGIESAPEEFLVHEAGSPLDETMRIELRNVLSDALNELGDSDRLALWRRLGRGDAYDAIARELQIKPANVRKRVQLSRQVLQTKLKNYR